MEIGALTKPQTLQAWIPFDEDTEVLIAYVPRHELQKIFKKATIVRYKNHQKTEEYDQETGDKLLGELAVKDWRPKTPNGKGFTLNGEPYPCTPGNVETLMSKWNDFARFVNESCTNLGTLVESERESVAKNSSITSGQS